MRPTNDWSPALLALTNGRHELTFVDGSILDKEIIYIQLLSLYFSFIPMPPLNTLKSWSRDARHGRETNSRALAGILSNAAETAAI